MTETKQRETKRVLKEYWSTGGFLVFVWSKLSYEKLTKE
jgi:hypothetical protein